jgi:DNA polymerase-3 subunit epsilon
MRWLTALFSSRPALSPEQAARLEAWRRLPPESLNRSLADTRCVVLDVESTGLDLARDRLIAIGACAVAGGRVRLGDSFEVVLRQDRASAKDNILVHGIGGQRQRAGIDPVEALLRFLEYLGKSPLVAYHVAFDQTMIRRAMKDHLGHRFDHPWVDLAYVMPGLMPEYARKYRALDHWTRHFHIGNHARHSALADALATAQLLLVALPMAARAGMGRYVQLQELEKAQRWIGNTA